MSEWAARVAVFKHEAEGVVVPPLSLAMKRVLGMVKDVGTVRAIDVAVLVRLQLVDRLTADKVDLVIRRSGS